MKSHTIFKDLPGMGWTVTTGTRGSNAFTSSQAVRRFTQDLFVQARGTRGFQAIGDVAMGVAATGFHTSDGVSCGKARYAYARSQAQNGHAAADWLVVEGLQGGNVFKPETLRDQVRFHS